MIRYWRLIAEVVAVCAAFAIGRFSQEAKVEEKIVYQDREVVKTVEVEKRVLVKGETRVVIRDRYIRSDGSVSEHEEERADTHTDDRTDRTGTSETTRVETRTVDKVVTLQPSWSVGVLVGADLNPAWQPITGAGPLALGVSVTYRVAGPFTVGAWGVHTGAFGVSLGAQF